MSVCIIYYLLYHKKILIIFEIEQYEKLNVHIIHIVITSRMYRVFVRKTKENKEKNNFYEVCNKLRKFSTTWFESVCVRVIKK